MNTQRMAAMAALLFIAALCYAGGAPDGSASAPVAGLMGLDEAMEAAAVAIEGKVVKGSEIAVYKITASHDAIGDYIAEELNDKISLRGNLIPLARGKALQYVDSEHQFQMSGMVSDASAVGIGHYLGAKVVITGTFDRYADFSQLRLRAVSVETSALLSSYTTRINNGDRILANITAPLGATIETPRVTENALDHLNRGKDLYAESKWDGAIAEFDKALAINKDLADAYFNRGNAYSRKGDYDRAIADFTGAIRIDPNKIEAYNNRGIAYARKGDYDRAIADYTGAIRIDPNDADAYYNRGVAYYNKKDYDRAIADWTSSIRINPNSADVYYNRGNAYYVKEDYDRAIADWTSAIRINPNFTDAYFNRGLAYGARKGDYDRAIADYTSALRLDPNYARAYFNRGNAYFDKMDYNRAIADYEATLRINPNHAGAKEEIENARKARGR
jgi:tetratricopeptide (TPR) repeat protein